jgi:hypothetical protein
MWVQSSVPAPVRMLSANSGTRASTLPHTVVESAELHQLSFVGLPWERLEAHRLSEHVRHDCRHIVEGQILRSKDHRSFRQL